MQFPESWLREFCNPPLSTQALADVLTMAGFEVEDLQSVAPAFNKVVVGEIKEATQHPNADRLRVCQVDVGQGAYLNIVCGAPNARVGIKVPCALVGAVLPPAQSGKDDAPAQPFEIKLGQLRGVESQGMLCSAKELGISDESQGLLELSGDAQVGQSIREHLSLDDTLFTLKLTPNLAHGLSVYGVARELSALTGAALLSPVFTKAKVDFAQTLPVQIEAPDLCGRFSGRMVRQVNFAAKTPQWMVDKLARCGQRSVNALVDISNYVMFELGRPSHIFDLDKIQGGLQVRWGKAGETLKLLNGNTVSLDDKVGVIADDTQVESLAGIMGGDATAVSESTQNIYIEAAYWHPAAIAGRSRRFNFSTDAGHRFERGVDPSTTLEHIERITELVLAICGTAQTQVGALDDQQPNVPAPVQLTLRVSRAAKVIGMALDTQTAVQALSRLGLMVVPDAANADLLHVTAPSYRFDLQIEEDLIEEIARMVGYNHLPHTPPQAAISARLRPEARRNPYTVKRALASMGYQETINFSFVPESWEQDLCANADPIRLLNPIASQMNVMRSSLMGSLLEVLQRNLSRKQDRVRIFEVGRVFLRDAAQAGGLGAVKGIEQPTKVAGLIYGAAQPVQWGVKTQSVDYFDIKADVETLLNGVSSHASRLQFMPMSAGLAHPALHPGRSARVMLEGLNGQMVEIGVLGELHPQWRQSFELPQAPMLFELDWQAVLEHPLPQFKPVSRFHPVQRDLSLVANDDVTHTQVLAAVKAAPSHGLVREALLFDVYKPKAEQLAQVGMNANEKSLSLRLSLGSDERSLTEADIETSVQAVLASLQTQLQVKLRT
jgi:phenylalanyl-tRNA synthetase beta chain